MLGYFHIMDKDKVFVSEPDDGSLVLEIINTNNSARIGIFIEEKIEESSISYVSKTKEDDSIVVNIPVEFFALLKEKLGEIQVKA